MCAWESISNAETSGAMLGANHTKSKTSVLFEARSERYFFKESGEDWVAIGQRGGQQHAVRFKTAHFARSQIGDDDDLAADQFFRLIVLRDAGKNLTLL